MTQATSRYQIQIETGQPGGVYSAKQALHSAVAGRGLNGAVRLVDHRSDGGTLRIEFYRPTPVKFDQMEVIVSKALKGLSGKGYVTDIRMRRKK